MISSSSDSLEEVIGLDIGYLGGVLHKRAQAQNDEVAANMDDYISEYVKQREKRANLRQMNDNSTHGRSVLGVSLHSLNLLGSSAHDGRTSLALAMDSMERSQNSDDIEKSTKSDSRCVVPSTSLLETSALRRVESDPVQQTPSNENRGDAWHDNR